MREQDARTNQDVEGKTSVSVSLTRLYCLFIFLFSNTLNASDDVEFILQICQWS